MRREKQCIGILMMFQSIRNGRLSVALTLHMLEKYEALILTLRFPFLHKFLDAGAGCGSHLFCGGG
jgi:hypothetical protein